LFEIKYRNESEKNIIMFIIVMKMVVSYICRSTIFVWKDKMTILFCFYG